jgi:hypothetical protein
MPTGARRRVAPDLHGYQRACDLISGQASIGPQGNNSSAPNVEEYAIPPRGLGRHSGNWCRGLSLDALATRAKPLSPDWLLTSARISSLSLAGLARRSAPGAGLEPPQIFVKRRFRQCRCTSICQVRPAHADHARSRAGTGPGSEGLPASGATPAGCMAVLSAVGDASRLTRS